MLYSAKISYFQGTCTANTEISPLLTPNFESQHFNCCQTVYIHVYICKCFSVVKIDYQTSSYIFLWKDIFLYW